MYSPLAALVAERFRWRSFSRCAQRQQMHCAVGAFQLKLMRNRSVTEEPECLGRLVVKALRVKLESLFTRNDGLFQPKVARN